jgi:hypothetical protein
MGVVIDQFDKDDLETISSSDEVELAAYLTQRIDEADIVLHNRQLFNLTLRQYFSGDIIDLSMMNLDLSISGTTPQEGRLNSVLYQYFAAYTHGIYTPPAFKDDDIKRKDVLPKILAALHVPTPQLYDSLETATYPCVIKKPTGRCSRHVGLADSLLQAQAFFEQFGEDCIIQEYVPPPTGFSAHIRTLSYGPVFLGAFLSFNPQQGFSTFSDGANFNVPLGKAFIGMHDAEEYADVLASCGVVDGVIPESLQAATENIGAYCSRHGVRFIGNDFVVQHTSNGPEFLAVDVNKDPGINSYLQIMDPEMLLRHARGRTGLTALDVAALTNAVAARYEQ